MRGLKGSLVVAFFSIIFVGSAVFAAPIVIKIGHVSHPDIQLPGQGSVAGLHVMKNYIEGATNGAIQVEIHPSGSLGSTRSLIELCQTGVLHIAQPYTSIMVPFCPEMGVTQIPFLFKDNLAAYRFMESPIGTELANIWLKKTGTRALNWPEGSGFRQLYARNKMIKSPADLRGLKVRVPENPGLLAMFAAYGSKTVTVTWTELYTALQTGVADACETEIGSMEDQKLFEVMRYATMTNHAWNLHPVLINEKFFKSLPEKDQMIIMRAAELETIVSNGFNRASENIVIQKAIKNGVKFYYPNETELEQFKKLGQKAYVDITAKSVSKEWIDKAFSAVEKIEADFVKEYRSKK